MNTIFKPIFVGAAIILAGIFGAAGINYAQESFAVADYNGAPIYGGSATLTSTNRTYIINAAASTATLPTAVGIAGRIFTIKSINFTGLVATTSSQTIDGGASYSLTASNKLVRVISDGTNWVIMASN